MSSQEILKEVAVEVSTCTRCDLCKSRTRAVPGEGNPHAKILFIGEGPGLHEDKQGRPFVGPSGQLLQELLKSINLKREDVFITNVVKCRPPDNCRVPGRFPCTCLHSVPRNHGTILVTGCLALPLPSSVRNFVKSQLCETTAAGAHTVSRYVPVLGRKNSYVSSTSP